MTSNHKSSLEEIAYINRSIGGDGDATASHSLGSVSSGFQQLGQ